MSLVASLLLASCLLPPVTAPVVDPFREPACRWCPGNRGIEYAVPSGTPVRAVATGTVTFSGLVAGTFYLVVDHGDGVRATYGRLTGSHLRVGSVVVAGAVVGTSTGSLHFGLRDGDQYVDPAPRLGRLVERARLVPTDGSPPRAAPPARLECPARRTRMMPVR
jgi:murein DD-endopeptidase MepM/ murein hydrolase activator NlpD